MDGNDYQSCNLQVIIGKIGHPLEEIRVRSLNNILLKFEHGLVQDSDLIKEKQLLVGLFEWFNYPNSPKQVEVLKLILHLSKHAEAHEHFVNIGAIKFLSELRENQCKEEQELVDAILENLFLLPDAPVTKDGEANDSVCLASIMPQNRLTDAAFEQQAQVQQPAYTKSKNSMYQEEVAVQQENNPMSRAQTDSDFIGFTMLSLKWINVSATDLNILSSTNKSLESTDSKSVSNSCNFLNDVVLRDFPPEIFLQHSQIVKNLFQLLNYLPKTSSHIPLKAVSCLSNLIRALLIQISSCQDAAIFNFKQSSCSPTVLTPDALSDHSAESLDSRPSAIGCSSTRPRGDGQDGDVSPDNVTVAANQNSPSLCSFDNSLLPENHFQEISIPLFCVEVISSCATLLHSSNPQVLTSTLDLLLLDCDLLSRCINAQIWNDTSVFAHELTEQLLKCYDILASAILVHGTQNTGDQQMLMKIHRLAVLGIASLWAKVLQTNINLEENVKILLPESCLLALSQLMLDFPFAKAEPSLHAFFAKCVRVFSPTTYLVYEVAHELSESLNIAIKCVNMVKDDVWNTEMFQYSEQALSCLHYFHYWQYVDYFLDCLSKICTTGPSVSSISLGIATFLKLLAYPDVLVRSRVVSRCLNIVKNCFGVCQAADISLSSGYNVRFLFNTAVMQEMIHFGLEDSSSEVSAMIREILLVLTQSQLLMVVECWEEFLNSLLPSLAVLQAYTDTSTSLGLSLFQLISTDNRNCSKVVLLKANVRLLFSKNQWLRMQVIPRIAWFLAQEKHSMYKCPSLSEIDATILLDIYVRDFLPLQSDFCPRLSCGQNVDKLFEIFASNNEELYARKLSGQQLAFLLSDSEMFCQFKQVINYAQLLDILHSCLSAKLPTVRQKSNAIDLIPITIEIIWKCLLKDEAFTSYISNNEYAFYSLLRASLIFSDDKQICGQIRMIVAAMSFIDCCEILRKNDSVLVFVAPAPIHERFALPSAETMHLSSRHCITLLSVKFYNSHTDQLFNSFLRFSWNASHSDGWNNFIALETFSSTCEFELNDTEEKLIKVTQQILSPDVAFKEIIKATSHKPVLLSLKMASWQFVAVPLRNINCTGSLKTDDFQASFSRFLSAPPKSNADKTLVKNILQFLNLVMRCHPLLNDGIIEWFYNLISLKDGAINTFLHKPSDLFDKDPSGNSSSHYNPLVKELLSFFISLLSKTPYSEKYTHLRPMKEALASMIQFILKHMNLAEAPQFYNLASLEMVLQCLVHISSRHGFSQGTPYITGAYLCRQLIGVLMEVIAAFHLTGDGTNHSFMGRGVTVSASICLSHVAAEMQTISQEEMWYEDWLYNHQSNESSPQLGLEWLIPLWTHQDPEVRVASLSIIVCLTNTKAGCKFALSQIQQVARGLVGVALSFLLESCEANIVREQAALLLVNLTSHLIPSEMTSVSEDDTWQKLIVTAEAEMQVPLYGIPALLVLLHRSSFMKEMATLFENFSVYPKLASYVRSRHIQYQDVSDLSSCTTLTSFDFGNMASANPTSVTSTHFLPNIGELEYIFHFFEELNNSTVARQSALFHSSFVKLNAVIHFGKALKLQHCALQEMCGLLHSACRPSIYSAAIQRNEIYEMKNVQPPGSFCGYRDRHVTTEQNITEKSRTDGCAVTSISTPSLVSSACLLLKNLVNMAPHDTLISMTKESIFDCLIRILDETKCTIIRVKATAFHVLTNLSDIIDMMSNIMDLLTICCRTDTLVNIGTHKTILTMLIDCLDLSFPEFYSHTTCYFEIAADQKSNKIIHIDKTLFIQGCSEQLQTLWIATYSLLTAILLSLDDKGLDRLAFSLLEKKQILLDNILYVIEPATPRSVKLSALLWLAQTLSIFYSISTKMQDQKLKFEGSVSSSEKLIALFDRKESSFGTDAEEIGVTLTRRFLILMKFFSHNPENPEDLKETNSVMNAFSALLIVSHSSKMTAIEGNLISSFFEQLRRINAHISLICADNSKIITDSKKMENIVLNLIGYFNLLKNLMHQCNKAKCVAANDNGFPSVVALYWAMALKERNGLLPTILSSLCTYVARCTSAGQSLATTSVPSGTQKGGTGVTLLHEVLKLCQQLLIHDGRFSNSDILELSFTLISSVSIVPLCRSVIAKSKLLRYFSIDKLKKGSLPSQKDVIAMLWLKLLVNFSFISEGQVAILSIPDIIEILLHFVNRGSLQKQEAALLILRNLCFLPLGKTKVLNSDELVTTLMSNALSGGQRSQVLAASAIWALLANSQKAKGVIKCDHFLHRVQDTFEILAVKDGLSCYERRAMEILENVKLLLEAD